MECRRGPEEDPGQDEARQDRVREAGQGGRSAALGFDRTPDGRLELNEEEADLVRRIYSLYVDDGWNIDRIASVFNGEAIPTKRAKANAAGKNQFRGAERWQRSTIQCVLRNPVYKGQYIYGKTQGRAPAGKDYVPSPKRPLTDPKLETAIKNRAFLPHEQVVVAVPAIVDEATWERAQRQRYERAAKSPLTTVRGSTPTGSKGSCAASTAGA